MSTPQAYELGWLSYLSNILSPTGQKVGVKTHFQNRGAAPDRMIKDQCRQLNCDIEALKPTFHLADLLYSKSATIHSKQLETRVVLA